MKRGDQIAYVPEHARGHGMGHPDVELGFIFDIGSNGIIFCRYWRRGELGKLRTISCSEATNERNLILYKTLNQNIVNKTMEEIEKNANL